MILLRKYASVFMSCVLAIALVPSVALADENDAMGGGYAE